MNLAAFFLLTVGSVLVLRSGERIDVEGTVREQDGRVVFRIPKGALYSLPLDEVDAEATRAAAEAKPEAGPVQKKLRVSSEERDRLLRQLEQNHSGQPAPRQRILEEMPPEIPQQTQSEWEWRRQARAYEESIRQSRENLQMLVDRAERLQGEIRGLLSLGFRPNQFSYQTTMLQSTLEQIPYAELSVTRAQRAYDQFREDARRQGVMPGWLR